MLLRQLGCLIHLRWGVAAGVLAGAAADAWWLHWPGRPGSLAAVAALLAASNSGLYGLLRRAGRRRRGVVSLAWAQILIDLACLSLLAVWTGGAANPLLGFYALHMVFASLLLTRAMAYGAAAAATVMFIAGLRLSGQMPDTLPARLVVAGWGLTLVLTVSLANQIIRHLRRHRQRLIGQNRRVRAMAQRLRRQQQSLIQHEKIVAMGQMAAGIAHEITNPLASMDSLLQLMQRGPQRLTAEGVDRLREQVARINAMVHQLTNFIHPTEFSWKTMSLNDLAESGLEMVRFDRRLRGVRIERRLCEPDRRVHVQPHAVQQALTNILLTALDAMADVAQPLLTVGTEHHDGTSLLWVRDNGHGIEPDRIRRIFEPFYTTKPVGKGTGLGLAISASLIENQGGRIGVRSDPGHGATFTIELPDLR